MNLHAAARREEAEDLVAINRMTAFGKCIIDTAQVLVDDHHVAALTLRLLIVLLELEGVGAVRLLLRGQFAPLVALLHEVGFHDLIDVEDAISQCLVERRDHTIPHAMHRMHERSLLDINLAVLELTFQFLLGIRGLRGCHLLQRLTYFGAGTAGLGHREPILLRHLIDVGHDLHLIAALEHMAQGDHLSANAPARAFVADFGVDSIGEIQHRGT